MRCTVTAVACVVCVVFVACVVCVVCVKLCSLQQPLPRISTPLRADCNRHLFNRRTTSLRDVDKPDIVDCHILQLIADHPTQQFARSQLPTTLQLCKLRTPSACERT